MLMASDLQNFLSPKLLQLHMCEDLLSNNSMVQTVCKSNSICKKYEFIEKNQNQNELKINFLFGLKSQSV